MAVVLVIGKSSPSLMQMEVQQGNNQTTQPLLVGIVYWQELSLLRMGLLKKIIEQMENNEQYIVQAIAESHRKTRSVLVRILNKMVQPLMVKTPDDDSLLLFTHHWQKANLCSRSQKGYDFTGRKQGYSNADASSILMLGNFHLESSTSSGDGGRSTTSDTTTQTGSGGIKVLAIFFQTYFMPDRIGSILGYGRRCFEQQTHV